MKLALSILPEKFGICYLDKKSPLPEWVSGQSNFTCVARTSDELSIILPQDKIPGGVLVEKNWRAFSCWFDCPAGCYGQKFEQKFKRIFFGKYNFWHLKLPFWQFAF
jgi:hypothetical protein